MLVQCWTDTMLFAGAQYQPCVLLQADIDWETVSKVDHE